MSCEVIENEANFKRFFYCRTHKVECQELGCEQESPKLGRMEWAPNYQIFVDPCTELKKRKVHTGPVNPTCPLSHDPSIVYKCSCGWRCPPGDTL